MYDVKELFLKYAAFNTQSNEKNKGCPSSEGQRVLAGVIAEDCRKMGLLDVEVTDDGYVYATLEPNCENDCPVIGFIAHMDTSPDFSGENVRPQIAEKDGQEIITTDGTTLLGADNKAGIAEILAAMHHLITNPQIKHGTIKIGFTPDEEIGRGADRFDVKKFGADFAYTVDGGELGELEYESFNAATAKIAVKGVSVHPGQAKGIMRNAALVALEMANQLPPTETPALTEKREGYFHLTRINATVESAELDYLIRDFETDGFNRRKDLILDIVLKTNEKYGDCVTVNIADSYYNMLGALKTKMHIVELAEKAMHAVGVTPIIKPVRGGTDGSRLSFMGLPCPNIFTGGQNFHGPHEYIPVPSMRKAVEVIVKICETVNS